MNKKGAELALNTIIIAVLSMIVLVILIGLFIRQSGNVGQQYTNISQQITTDQGDNCASLINLRLLRDILAMFIS